MDKAERNWKKSEAFGWIKELNDKIQNEKFWLSWINLSKTVSN
jgi:hypothetical protein